MQDKREEGGNCLLNDYSGFPDPDADSVIETDPGVTRVRKRSGPVRLVDVPALCSANRAPTLSEYLRNLSVQFTTHCS